MGLSRNNIGISVVIPCYNSQDTIAETLRCIISQMYSGMEIIVVDDGSKDRTGQIVSSYSEKVKYVYQENRGVSEARNRGAALAEKEWIAFCDSDDVWYNDKIRICREVIRSCKDSNFIFHDYSIIYGNRVVAERGTHSDHTFFPLMRNYSVTIPGILPRHREILLVDGKGAPLRINIYSGNGFRWMILGNFIMPSSVVMKRSLFLESGGFDRDFKVAEDTELFLRIAKATDFTYIDRSLHGYRRSHDSLISKYLKETVIFGIRGIEKNCLADKELASKHKKWIDMSLGRRMSDLAYFYMTEMEKDEALKNALGALRYTIKSRKAWTVILLWFIPNFVLRIAKRIKLKKREKKMKSEIMQTRKDIVDDQGAQFLERSRRIN